MSQQQITVKPEPGAMKYVENAAKDLKGAIDGGLDNAMKSIVDLVKSSADPALGMLLGQLNSETSDSRIKLMNSLLTLVESEGVQTALGVLFSGLNDLLLLMAKAVPYLNIITPLTRQINILIYQIALILGKVETETAFGHTESGGGEMLHNPQAGSPQNITAPHNEPYRPEYAWWDPRGWFQPWW